MRLSYGHIALFVIGIILCISSIHLYRNERRFYQSAIPVSTKIIEIESYQGNDGDKHRRIIVSYEVEEETFVQTLEYYYAGMKVGDEVIAYYEYGNPFNVSVISYYGPVILGIIGVILTIYTGLMIRFSLIIRKQKRLKIVKKRISQ